MRRWIVPLEEGSRVEETAHGGEIHVRREVIVGLGGRPGKRYDGSIADVIAEAETLDNVDELLREAIRETTASAKTIRGWLFIAVLRKLALSQKREEVFDATIAAGKGLALRDGRHASLANAERRIVTSRANHRLLELERASQPVGPLLVDGAGQPLEATA